MGNHTINQSRLKTRGIMLFAIAAFIFILIIGSNTASHVAGISENKTANVIPTLGLSPSPTSTPTEIPTPQPVDYPTNTPTPYPQDNFVPQSTYNYNEIPTPTPQPIYQPQNVNCYTSGDYTHCSDGSSSIQSGDTTFVNGGANGNSGTCYTSGGYTHCSDGSSAINSGNVSFIHGDGTSSTCFHNGNMTNCN